LTEETEENHKKICQGELRSSDKGSGLTPERDERKISNILVYGRQM
jgi:hypothetical protein